MAQKERNSILVRVAKLLRLSIYYLHAMTLIQTIDKLKKKVQHAQVKIFSEGSNSDNFFKVDEEREEPNTIKSGS